MQCGSAQASPRKKRSQVRECHDQDQARVGRRIDKGAVSDSRLLTQSRSRLIQVGATEASSYRHQPHQISRPRHQHQLPPPQPPQPPQPPKKKLAQPQPWQPWQPWQPTFAWHPPQPPQP